MSETRTKKTYEEKLADKDKKIQQLNAEKSKLKKQENARLRKARDSRLYKRHAFLEKYMPGLAVITNEKFYKFVRIAINTSYGRNKLAELIEESGQSIDCIYVEMTDEDCTEKGQRTPKAEPSWA